VLVCRLFPSQTFAINMQIKTGIFIAIAIGCVSAENASMTPNSGMLMVNPTSGKCITMLGTTADPFNALNEAPCTGNVTQLWTLNPGDQTLCVAANGFCMKNNNGGVQLVHPTDHAQFEYNPSTQCVYAAGDCNTMLTVNNGKFDGTEPLIMYDPGTYDCNGPTDNQRFNFEAPAQYLA
jgi:hypothetical protein